MFKKGESHEKEKNNHHNNSSHYTLHYHIDIRYQSSPEEKRSTDQTGTHTVPTGFNQLHKK